MGFLPKGATPDLIARVRAESAAVAQVEIVDFGVLSVDFGPAGISLHIGDIKTGEGDLLARFGPNMQAGDRCISRGQHSILTDIYGNEIAIVNLTRMLELQNSLRTVARAKLPPHLVGRIDEGLDIFFQMLRGQERYDFEIHEGYLRVGSARSELMLPVSSRHVSGTYRNTRTNVVINFDPKDPADHIMVYGKVQGMPVLYESSTFSVGSIVGALTEFLPGIMRDVRQMRKTGMPKNLIDQDVGWMLTRGSLGALETRLYDATAPNINNPRQLPATPRFICP